MIFYYEMPPARWRRRLASSAFELWHKHLQHALLCDFKTNAEWQHLAWAAATRKHEGFFPNETSKRLPIEPQATR
jgi:hypothetical protein